MSEKRFIISKNIGERCPTGIIDVERQTHLWVVEVVDLLNKLYEENEQLRQELKEYKENWDDMVEMATKTSLRNIELDEQIGRLQQGIRIAYEKKPYPTFEDIQNECDNDE